jgi:beta-lactamase regulating signal transducer with metallopeptidase domain
MSELFAQNALLFAGEAFVMSAVVLALAWEASHLVRNRASLRHLVWVGAFAALLLLPVLAWIVPAQIHFTLPATHAAAAAPMVQDADIGPDIAPLPQPAFHLSVTIIATAIMAVWLMGVLIVALRGLVAVFGLRALERRSRVHVFEESVLPELERHYEIRVADAPNGLGPITWGLFRPVILLPFPALFWTRERLQSVLLHEAAHIRRHDSLSQMLSLLAGALYWPNPLVWLAARALRGEAEIAADDEVLAAGVRPSSYAGELLQLASEFRSRQPALAGMPLFMAAPSALEARVKSVLAPTHKRLGVTSMDVLKIGSIAFLATAALTLARPSIAQDAPQPADAPSAVSAPAPLSPPATPTPAAAPAPLTAQSATPLTPVEPATPADTALSVAETISVHPWLKVRQTDRVSHGHKIHRIWIDADMRGATAEEMARMRRQIEQAEAKVRAARPEIERAQAEMRAHEAEMRARDAEMRAMRDEGPRIEAEVQAALAKAQPEIDRAIAEAHRYNYDLKINKRINHALKHAHERIEIEVRADQPGDRGQAGPNADVPDAN